MKYSEIIGALEAEISAEYLPGAIAWADVECDHAWSRAIERFEIAITASLLSHDNRALADEGEFYKNTVIDLCRRYKAHKNMGDADEFLTSLRKR